jgi:hypothetical protein
MALYTRSAVRSFFHAVPYTNLGILVWESFPKVMGEDKAEEAIVLVRSLVKRGPLTNRAVSADFALFSRRSINYPIVRRYCIASGDDCYK